MSELVEGGVLTLKEAIARMTVNPAGILGLDKGTLSPGADADITIVDPDAEYTVEKFCSKSNNSPFIGRKLKGVVETVILGGKPVLENGKLR